MYYAVSVSRDVTFFSVLIARLPMVFPSVLLGLALSYAFSVPAEWLTSCRRLLVRGDACASDVAFTWILLCTLIGATSYCLAGLVSRMPVFQEYKVRAALRGVAFEEIVVSFALMGAPLYYMWLSSGRLTVGFGVYLVFVGLVGLHALLQEVIEEKAERHCGIRY